MFKVFILFILSYTALDNDDIEESNKAIKADEGVASSLSISTLVSKYIYTYKPAVTIAMIRSNNTRHLYHR